MPSNDLNNARRYVERDKDFLWHPFTPMKQWIESGDEPGRVIVAGEGFELIDHEGRRFIDGFGSLWCSLHGHRVPEIDDAIRQQLDRIAHSTLLGHASPPSIELAERLVRISPPGLEKVFYSDSGATAVEVALKMAYQFYRNRGQAKRHRFLALSQSYHGDTIGSVSIGGIDTFHRMFRPLLFEATFVDSPNPYYHPAGNRAGEIVLQQVEDILAGSAEEYCAMIVEPLVQGAAGMLTHPAGFLKGLRELTRKYDVLLIADEVATGFCATGKLFACEHEGVCPDLMCLGKRLTGGYLPVAATLATRDVFDAFCGEVAEGKTFYHGHTFTGNALGCAAGVASIDRIESTGLLQALPAKIELISSRMLEVKKHPNVGDVRQCGLMTGIELVAKKDGAGNVSRPSGTRVARASRPRTHTTARSQDGCDTRGQDARDTRMTFDPQDRVGAKVCFAARSRGLIIRPLGDVVVLMPAPAMDLGTLDRLLTITLETIHDYFA